MKSMRFDLHIHSRYSYDSIVSPMRILKRAQKIGLNGIAITDHDTIKGALEASKRNVLCDFTVIIGCEINTEIGDIIGLFLHSDVASRNSMEAIEEIRAQDGIVVLPHPFKSHILNEKLINAVDLIEGYNGRTSIEGNKNAQALSRKCNIPMIGGSDAHFLSEVGNVETIFDCDKISDMKKVLLSGDVEIKGIQSNKCFQAGSMIIKAMFGRGHKK